MEGDGDKRYMSQNDPYQSIRESEAASIRPDFSADSKPSGAEKQKTNKTTQSKAPKADASDLRNAENAASQNASTSNLDAQSGENDVSSGFTNNVGKNGQVPGKTGSEGDGKDDGKGGEGKGGGDSSGKAPGPVGRFMKKYMPILSIILTLSGGGSFMMLSQATLPFTTLQGLKDWFNSSDLSVFKRHSNITENVVKNTLRKPSELSDLKNPVKGKKYKVSKKFSKRLAAQNIEIPKTGANAGKMVFTDANGKQTAVAPSEFKTEYDSNPEFRKAYSTASHPYKTAFSNFKDKIFKKFKSVFGINDSKWGKNYDPESDADGQKAKDAIQGGMDQDTDSTKTTSLKTTSDTDENGNPISKPSTDTDSGGNARPQSDTETTKLPKAGDSDADISDKVGGIGKAASTLMSGLNIACGFAAAAGAITLVAAAEQLYRVVNVAMDYFQAFEQSMAGDGSTSPIHALAKSLVHSESTEYTYSEYTGTLNPTSETQVSSSTTTKTVTGSAVTSQGFNSLFSKEIPDGRDDSVKTFNTLEQIKQGTKSFSGLVKAGLNSFRACTYTRLAQAAIGAVADTVEILTCIASAGIGCVVSFLKDLAIGAAKATITLIVVEIVKSIFTTWFKNFLSNLLTKELGGTVLGDTLVAGMHAIMSGNHRAGGGVIADKAGYIETAIVQSEVIADRAKTERLTRSPFDYTSKYTFLGSLATTLIPVTLQSTSVVGAFRKFGSTVSSSVSSLMPGASAANAGIDAENAQIYTERNCPYLADIGAIGDAYCLPYTTTDFDTIEINNNAIGENDDPADAINSPYNIMAQVNGYGGFDLGGESLENVETPKIDKDSDLAEYIVYCNQRQSAFGIADQNIASEIDGTSTGSSIGDFGIGMIPIIGDGADIIGAKRTLDKFGYVDGSACVMHDEGTGSSVPSYSERRAYARFVEDQRYLESTGMIETSSVTAFLDEYYEEHPLDNSHEGIIARLSGLTKDQVIATYDIIEAANFLANYDPTDYYPTPAIHKEEPDYTIEDERVIKDEVFVAIVQTGYFSEYRQRNFASA